jgi:hypothetical protein
VCATYWIAEQQGGFVPQSLEITGETAYVGGYGPSRLRGLGHCQIAVVDLGTGRTTAFQDGVVLRGTYPHWVRCDHGGGMGLSKEGLWLTQRHRIWLLDPARLGTGTNPVLRTWTVPASMRASTLLVHGGRLAIASFNLNRDGRIWTFDLQKVLAPGTTRLVRPVSIADAPRRLQGITAVGSATWFDSSTTRCGALRPGTKEAVAFVPGAEDVAVAGQDIWTVSEAGSKRYFVAGHKAVPGLFRLDRSSVLAGPDAGCGF